MAQEKDAGHRMSLDQVLQDEWGDQWQKALDLLRRQIPPAPWAELEPQEYSSLIQGVLLAPSVKQPLLLHQTNGKSFFLCHGRHQIPEVLALLEDRLVARFEILAELPGDPPVLLGVIDSSSEARHAKSVTPQLIELAGSLIDRLGLAQEDPRRTQIIESLDSCSFNQMTSDQQLIVVELLSQSLDCDAARLRLLSLPNEEGGSQVQLIGAWRSIPRKGWPATLFNLAQREGIQVRRMVQHLSSPLLHHPAYFVLEGSSPPNWPAEQQEAFLRSCRLLGTFSLQDRVESTFVSTSLLKGGLEAVVRAMVRFAHQVLLYLDSFQFNLANCEDALCAHPDFMELLCGAFEQKFDPRRSGTQGAEDLLQQAEEKIRVLATGHEETDRRRRLILRQALNLVRYAQKTTFYSDQCAGLSFRMDPTYLLDTPAEAQQRFSEAPFAVLFFFVSHALGFHIRFRDLARGGLRTVVPVHMEQYVVERNQIFQEGYNLAATQQRKNKDIPEGGSKGILLLNPFEWVQAELSLNGAASAAPEERIELQKQLTQALMYQAQRQYIAAMLDLINTGHGDTLLDPHIVDHYGHPEYIYLGPDENMHNSMIVWIARFAQQSGYLPGSAFISSKPRAGINHKEYGVTSLGVHVYVEQVLDYLGVRGPNCSFVVKMSGGPDGDVAGNEILNLGRMTERTCFLRTLIDGSGTIFDPVGLDFSILGEFFVQGTPIHKYPAEALHPGGFLVDSRALKPQASGAPLMKCLRATEKGMEEVWLEPYEAQQLLKNTVLQTPADLFIPAGGRPRTLHESNAHEFCSSDGTPTARAIVEGANLYLTPHARRFLEEHGVLIIKDSSANKGGVICSSYEVLLGLTLSEEEFVENKPDLMVDVLALIRQRALDEARLLLRSHAETGRFLTDLSDEISLRINGYKDQLLTYFKGRSITWKRGDPLTDILLNYCPKTLREKFPERILERMPVGHQKAILACAIAAQTVYHKGLQWHPRLEDVLPVLLEELPHRSTEEKGR